MKGFVAGSVIATLMLALTAAVPKLQDEFGSDGSYFPGFTQSFMETEEPAKVEEPRPEPELNALLAEHMREIEVAGKPLQAQAVLVETADGTVLMAQNEDQMLNPASVLKMATTLAALEKFGPEHRFRTVVTADGAVDGNTLRGSIGVRTDGDPTLGRDAIQPIVAGVKGAGIQKVEGDLVVSGPLSFQTTDEPAAAAAKLKDALARAGVKFTGQARLAEQVGGTELVSVESEKLIDIVTRQNAHSINRTADNMGTSVGGPAGLRRYLIETVGLEPQSVHITHPSGLDDNLLTARGTMLVLRRLSDVCARHNISLDRVMPLNGVDNSTMRARMTGNGMKGTVLAKTGTQANWGGGITTLAGVVHTRQRGPLYFVILNSVGDVHTYRKWQDSLLNDTVAHLGGPQPIPRTVNIVPPGNGDHSAHMLARQKAPEKAPAPDAKKGREGDGPGDRAAD